MASVAAALLDELMGRNRNSNPNEDGGTIKWSDQQVCKHFLCGYCPSELFTNTKADLGPCTLIHDEPLRKEYQSSDRFEKAGYEERWIEVLEDIVSDVDKKIKRGHHRLAMTQEDEPSSTQPHGPRHDQITQLTEKINDLVEKAEKLGNEGKVEEAQGVMKLCEQLRKERYHLENLSNDRQDHISQQAKQMEVCPVCGAFLIVGDAESRQREHLLGKQHMGYAQMRATVDEFKDRKRQKVLAHKAEMEKKREEERKRREEREKARRRSRSRDRRGSRRGSRERRKSRSRDRRRSRSRDRVRRRTKSRDRRRSRSPVKRRSRSRDKRKSRDRRSTDRSRRSRSGDKSRRSRSRDRSKKSRSRDRSKISRSGDRSKRSRSGDRSKRSKSRDRNDKRDSRKSSRAGSRNKDRDGSGDGVEKRRSGDEAVKDKDQNSDDNAVNSEEAATAENNANDNTNIRSAELTEDQDGNNTTATEIDKNGHLEAGDTMQRNYGKELAVQDDEKGESNS